MRRPLRGRVSAAAALVAASAVAALAFPSSAQAASSYNVMLMNIPSGVNHVELRHYYSGVVIGCYSVQSGQLKNTGYQVSAGDDLVAFKFSESGCSNGYLGGNNSGTVPNNLTTTNFWFSLS